MSPRPLFTLAEAYRALIAHVARRRPPVPGVTRTTLRIVHAERRRTTVVDDGPSED
jgi:hypothetical protein